MLTRATPVIQIMISQVIIGYRTWNITRRSREMGVFLLVFGFTVTALEWYSNVDARIPVQDEVSAPRKAPVSISAANHFYPRGSKRFSYTNYQVERRELSGDLLQLCAGKLKSAYAPMGVLPAGHALRRGYLHAFFFLLDQIGQWD